MQWINDWLDKAEKHYDEMNADDIAVTIKKIRAATTDNRTLNRTDILERKVRFHTVMNADLNGEPNVILTRGR